MGAEQSSNFWLTTDEENADLPYVARQVLEEIEGHLGRGEAGPAEEHLEDLTRFSAQIEDHLVQAKIRLEIAQTAIRMGRLDIARPAVDTVLHLLDGPEARRRQVDRMLAPIQNHYLAKAYLLLAGLEFQSGNDHSLVLANLQKCLDKLCALSAYHSDHLLTSGNSYKEWSHELRRAITTYVSKSTLDLWGTFPNGSGGGQPGSQGPGATAPGAPEPQEPVSGSRSPADNPGPPLAVLEPNGVGPIPILGEIAIGAYLEMENSLAPWENLSSPGTRGGRKPLALEGDFVEAFKIDGRPHRLYDLRQCGGILALEPQAHFYFILRIAAHSPPYAGLIAPGDYVLVRHQETAGIEDLVVYQQQEKTAYRAMLGEFEPAEIYPPPYKERIPALTRTRLTMMR